MAELFDLDVQVSPTVINQTKKDEVYGWSLACSGPPTNTLAV